MFAFQETIARQAQRLVQDPAFRELRRLERDFRQGKRDKSIREALFKARQRLLTRFDPTVVFLYLRATGSADADALRAVWRPDGAMVPQDLLPLLRPEIPLNALPSGSFLVHIPFRLATSYFSRDERDFYLLDNPVRRERTFDIPMVASTGWKGALRAAMRQAGMLTPESEVRLFGQTKGEEGGARGRLHFFPSYFFQAEVHLEVLNPHPRETGAGSHPILMEVVPPGAESEFWLLYVPLWHATADTALRQAVEDLPRVVQGVRAMLTEYGFGAKTSAGFGRAEDALPEPKGTLRMRWGRDVLTPPPMPALRHLVRQAQVLAEKLREALP